MALSRRKFLKALGLAGATATVGTAAARAADWVAAEMPVPIPAESTDALTHFAANDRQLYPSPAPKGCYLYFDPAAVKNWPGTLEAWDWATFDV